VKSTVIKAILIKPYDVHLHPVLHTEENSHVHTTLFIRPK